MILKKMIIGVILLSIVTSRTMGMASDTIRQYRWQVGFSPSAFMNIFPGVQGDIEFQIYKKLFVGLGGAYIFEYVFGDRDVDYLISGYRIRPEVGISLTPSNTRSIHLGIAYNFRFLRYEEELVVLKANGQYQQYITDVNRVTFGGLAFKMASHHHIDDRLLFKWGFLFGFGGYSLKSDQEERTLLERSRLFWNTTRPNHFFMPIFGINIQVAYRL